MKIQKTLFGESIVVEYEGVNCDGDVIVIPNFQPIVDDNPRLDMENEATKRHSKE